MMQYAKNIKVVAKDSLELLRKRVAALQTYQGHWFAIRVCLSELKGFPQAVKAMASLLSRKVRPDECALYVLPDGDTLLMGEGHAPFDVSRVVKDILFLFGNSPMAWGEVTEQGNRLCHVYQTKEDLTNLAQLVESLASGGFVPAVGTAPTQYEPDKEGFLLAKKQRAKRRRACVMVVEDQRFSRQLVIEILSRDFDVIAADNGLEALKLYAEQAPDIVFLDIDLPQMDGHETLEHIAELDSDAYVIMLTASSYQNDVQRARDKKVQGYIVKPFTRQKIERYVAQFRQTHSGTRAG